MRFKASFSDKTARRGRAILRSLIDFSLFMLSYAFFTDAENLSIQFFLLNESVRLRQIRFAPCRLKGFDFRAGSINISPLLGSGGHSAGGSPP
jgi:hypothetical protein